MPQTHLIVDLPGIIVRKIENKEPAIAHCVSRLKGPCPHCFEKQHFRKKAKVLRRVHHGELGNRKLLLHIETYKYHCQSCKRYFHQRLPGILPRYKGSQKLKERVFSLHLDGVSHQAIKRRFKLAQSTLERWFHEYYRLANQKLSHRQCPQVLGIDEHTFKKQSYATTLCDLKKNKVFDVVAGKSKADLKDYLNALEGKEKVKVVCIDLSSSYRSLVKHYFPNAKIVADRFHVVRLINHSFLKSCQQLDPDLKYRKGQLNLFRTRKDRLKPRQVLKRDHYFLEQPAIEALYDFKNELHQLMLVKRQTAKQCRHWINLFLDKLQQLKQSPIEALRRLGRTLYLWRDEIARMWRFTKNNGITEGFHRKMKLIQRRAYGFRNFENYRMRVRLLCA